MLHLTNKDYYLISKLRKFNNYPAIEAFLTQAKLLIDTLNIVGKPHNFLCTLPASTDSMSVQIVNKTILKAEFQSKGKASFYYILPQASYDEYIQKSSKDNPLQLEALTDGEEPYIFKFAYQTFDFENDIKDNWLKTAKKAFDSYQINIKQPLFNHELYKLITDATYKNEIFAFAQSNQPIPALPTDMQPNENTNAPLNQILFGAPGTGKTYHSVNEAISIANPAFDLSQERSVVKAEFDRLVGEGQIQFVTFHQSFGYEDFVEGIKPVLSANNDAPIRYEIRSGVFKEMCINAKTPNASGLQEAYNKLVEKLSEEETITLNTKNSKAFSVYLNENENLNLVVGNPPTQRGSLTKDTLQRYINGEKVHHPSYAWGVVNYLQTHFNYSDVDNTPKNFVLIIDEINRGNVAQIFGELITLIEESKRAGKAEAIELVLPYSKDAFSVPANLYLIGTMNTADRSVEALDTALRRRFSFKEMRPDYALLPTVEGVEVGKMLQTINTRIELLLDKDHAIGHSYFLGLETIEDLRLAFENKLIPLLQEYFFGDFSKIGLVLGEAFVAPQKQDKKDIFAPFASVDKSLRTDLLRREVYHFTESKNWDATAFQGIYS
ncbi:MAG: hypothetical protein EAZ95_17770 [Bacteroidetes bacterium]|nr:MAG: hypothetical protein EAZ95_17770 [Bacteroidota bacterium]